MFDNWGEFLKQYRLRHGLTQVHLATILGVAPRAVSLWERGRDEPSPGQQRRLRDLAADPSAILSWSLFASIKHCPLPRALSRTQNLRLQALSRPAIEKRPSVTELIGCDLAPIASGVLEEMLDDRPLQRSIASGEIFCVMTTTRSVLQTAEHPRIGAYRTAISYFFHEGALYSDAISAPAPADAVCGYWAIPMDDMCAALDKTMR